MKALHRFRRVGSLGIRETKPEDNPAIQKVIHSVMKEHHAVGDGFSIQDPEVSFIHEAYQNPGHVYYVIENASGEVVGGAGIAPLKGGEPGVCELQKMYFMPEVRGLGFGQKLLDLCLSRAEEFGYRICYLESLESMKTAAALYLKNGFKKLSFGLGNTGHHACNSWYAKVLGEGFTAKLVTSEEEISSILEMRREVFVVEQKIPDDLEWDEPKEELAQFVVFHGEFPVSTGRLRVVDDKVKFERILTRKAYRHQGVGRVLMEAMMQYARQQYPGLKFLLNSQLSAKPFYESLGWQAIGDQFYEADIPHYTMIL